MTDQGYELQKMLISRGKNGRSAARSTAMITITAIAQATE
jgi:hypothetical protein